MDASLLDMRLVSLRGRVVQREGQPLSLSQEWLVRFSESYAILDPLVARRSLLEPSRRASGVLEPASDGLEDLPPAVDPLRLDPSQCTW